jgi:putative hydrolase of the HAD superfamily
VNRTSPRCVVFDVDDTLYLERDYVRSGFDAVGRWIEHRFGRRDFAGRAWACFEAGGRRTTFDVVLPELGIDPDPELVRKMVSVYRSHVPDIHLVDDAATCLRSLDVQLRTAVLTDGPLESQRAKVRALRLEERMGLIVLTAELGPGAGKPSPRGFEVVQERFGGAAGEYVYVADNPLKDFSAPRSIGWTTVRVRRQGGLHAARESGPDVDLELTGLHDLDRILADRSAGAAR